MKISLKYPPDTNSEYLQNIIVMQKVRCRLALALLWILSALLSIPVVLIAVIKHK